ncbi:hypothetical protein [Streptomyces sp. Y1]|uniref:Uncharacterized protein n=1 Tax=Streptomyces sp. Y1 TaxID=3238634 RepID=A0AB39TMC1_9ACTN
MTTIATIDSATAQVDAAGALLAILTAHPNLPAPDVRLASMKVPGTHDWTWGLNIALHSRLDQFEQWRAALGLDPAGVEHLQHGTTAWLTVTGTHSGAPVVLYGYYDLRSDAER